MNSVSVSLTVRLMLNLHRLAHSSPIGNKTISVWFSTSIDEQQGGDDIDHVYAYNELDVRRDSCDFD